MMESVKYLMFGIGVLGLFSCGDFNSHRSEYANEESSDLELQEQSEGIQLTGRMVTCNKCMGYGMVQDGMYGQPQICKFCWMSTNMLIQQGWTGFDGRYGMVDAAFNQLPADYFDFLDSEDAMSTGNGGANNAQIEDEIERHLRNIESMERQLDYIEGTVNRTYLQQQIILEQQEVRQLRSMLE